MRNCVPIWLFPRKQVLKSAYGLGPAASKVYQVGKGLSIGGYGEANYQKIVSDEGKAKDNADFERLVLYVGYKFTDWILFNSEIEFEHGTTGEGDEEEGEVSVEFAALDFFIDPRVNIRTGMVLMPMGLINQIHEPPFFFGNNRPVVDRRNHSDYLAGNWCRFIRCNNAKLDVYRLCNQWPGCRRVQLQRYP